jgi:hypothetical protein
MRHAAARIQVSARAIAGRDRAPRRDLRRGWESHIVVKENAMTRGVLERWRWVWCAAVGALLGGAAGCAGAGNDPEVPETPRAGPILAAGTHRIASSEAFTAFAVGARLDQAQRISVARTLALYLENDASLQATAEGTEQLSSMHKQLLGDTVAQLRARLPEASWDAFTRSGLLPEAAAVGASDGRRP